MNRFVPALLVLLPVTGCAREEGAYPSLSPRAVEKLGFEEPEASPSAPAAPDPKLDLEIAAATAQLDKAVDDFAAAATRAQAAAGRARGAAAGSEPWIEAQTALAELDRLRAETSEVLGDLERLSIDRATALAPDYPALETARGRARAELDGEEATIKRIGAGLAPA